VTPWRHVAMSERHTVTIFMLLGIGDSAASYFGSKFGKTKFRNSPKTFEGTAASIVAEVIFVVAVDLFFVDGVIVGVGVVFAATLCSVVEATTTQVDNIVLPFIMFLMMSVLT
jgi:dolichol kinase